MSKATQRAFPIPTKCPFCGSSVSLVDSAQVYRKSYGLMYLCDRYPACDARVGVHQGTTTPLGTMANYELRMARNAAHAAFDPLWKDNPREHRGKAYKWLSEQLGIPREQTHIAMFDVEQCRRVVAVVEQWHASRYDPEYYLY